MTTFAVVAGVFWCFSGTFNILILGFANLLADGFSMSIGNYLSTKTQREYIQNQRKREEWKIGNSVEQKKVGIRNIYREKAFKDELFDEIVRVITSRRKIWIDTMKEEELGLIGDKRKSRDSAITTFVVFNIIACSPLVPFVFIQIFGTGLISTTSTRFLYSVSAVRLEFFARPFGRILDFLDLIVIEM